MRRGTGTGLRGPWLRRSPVWRSPRACDPAAPHSQWMGGVVKCVQVGVRSSRILAPGDETQREPGEQEPAHRHERQDPRGEADQEVEEALDHGALEQRDAEPRQCSRDRGKQHHVARDRSENSRNRSVVSWRLMPANRRRPVRQRHRRELRAPRTIDTGSRSRTRARISDGSARRFTVTAVDETPAPSCERNRHLPPVGRRSVTFHQILGDETIAQPGDGRGMTASAAREIAGRWVPRLASTTSARYCGRVTSSSTPATIVPRRPQGLVKPGARCRRARCRLWLTLASSNYCIITTLRSTASTTIPLVVR